MMLQYDMIAGFIQFTLHLVQIPNFTSGKSSSHHNRASSMLYGWYDRELMFIHQFFAKHRPPYLSQRFQTLICKFKGLYSTALLSSLCALVNWSLLTLFYFLNSGFLTAILPHRPASQSFLLTVDVATFFSQY